MGATFKKRKTRPKKIRGLENARTYLKTSALENPTKRIHIEFGDEDVFGQGNAIDSVVQEIYELLDFDIRYHCYNSEEFYEIDIRYHCYNSEEFYETYRKGIVISPIMLAILLKEYDAAEKLVDALDVVSLHGLGGLISGFYKLTWEGLLYSPYLAIPEKLRDKILGRLETEGDGLYHWSLRWIKDFENAYVREMLASDVRKYPKLFERDCHIRTNSLADLNFMLTLFSSDDRVNGLMEDHENTELLFAAHRWNIKSIRTEILALGQIVEKLKNRKNMQADLWWLLICAISQLRLGAFCFYADGIMETQVFRREENKVWKMMDALPFEEKDFEKMAHHRSLDDDYRLEVLYELALRKLGKRMPLQAALHGGDTLMSLLGLAERCGGDSLWVRDDSIVEGDNKMRIMKLLYYVSDIEYPDTLIPGDRRRYLTAVILQHANDLKDFFVDLLRKGFVPKEDLDYVMVRIKVKKECEYMKPFLILQKFGVLPKKDRKKPSGGKKG